MATGGILYSYRDNFRADKALIAAQYSGAKVKLVCDPPEFTIGETNKSDAFLKKFPLGKVPAFEGSDGTLLFKSNAIAFFLANDVLRGSSIGETAAIQQWFDFSDNDILPAYCSWIFPIIGVMQINKQTTEKAKEDIKIALGILNQHLLTRTYLVGERITLADICVACHLLHLYKLVLDPEFRKPFVNTNRWFTTLINQPQFKAVLGDVVLCQTMATVDTHKNTEVKKPADKLDTKKQPEKDKKAEKPKAETATEDPEEEDNEFQDKPSKDPFGHLNKGTFNLEDFKRVYSNNDTKTVALPYFWKNFDKENYSIWYCEYKYPTELQMVFMTCNLVTGMFQRLDRMRKHSFGSMCVFGQDNNNTISGLWVWKGQELAFTLSDDLQIDYESYTWKKLEAETDETKKLVEEYFSWEGNFGGKKFNQGKVFK